MADDTGQGRYEEFRQRLDARRAELERLIADGRREDAPISPDSAIGRLTRQDAMQQQMAAALVRRYEQELTRVETATADVFSPTCQVYRLSGGSRSNDLGGPPGTARPSNKSAAGALSPVETE